MMKGWMNKFRDWAASLARHRHAQGILFLVSFAESSFFPIPPDVLLVPMVLANRAKWVQIALITTIASVLGAIAGYIIGVVLFDIIAQPLINLYHLEASIQIVEVYFDKGAFLAMLLSAFTPIPFKLFTIAGGLFRVSFLPFVIASIIGRGARFFLEAYLVQKAGKHVSIGKHPIWYITLVLLVVIAGVVFLLVH